MPQGTHHIGYGEAASLLAVYIGAKVFTSCPSQLIYLASTSAWITAFLATIPATLGLVANYYFVSRFGGISFQHCLEQAIGKLAAKLLGTLFLLFILLMNAVTVREFSGGFKSAILAETPLNVIALIILSLAVWPAALGLEPLGRFASLSFAPLAATYSLIILLSIRSEFSVSEIFPLWGVGFTHTIVGAIPCSSLYSEALVVGLLLPHISEDAGRKGFWLMVGALWLSAAFMSITIFTCISVFTAPAAAQMLYPMLQLARLFVFGNFLERIEGVFVFSWFFSAALKISFGNLIAAHFLSDILGVKRWSAMLLPLVLATYYLAFYPQTLVDVFKLQTTVFRSIGWVVAFVFPLVLLGITRARGLPR